MTNFLSPNSMLIQGATMSDLESMMSRLLDKKLANILESTPKVEESPKKEDLTNVRKPQKSCAFPL